MFSAMNNRTFRYLFAAQAVALLGTGLTTVALGLLAYELAGNQAGIVLGTALAIKMATFVLVAPVATALAERFPRRSMLVTLDLARAGIALALPFVTEVWHVYLLIFLLQSASATFTPAFQAIIPDILSNETEYTRALSLSRLAYDLENLISPVLAAFLLTLIGFHSLFMGTVAGFLGSALLVLSVKLPNRRMPTAATLARRMLFGSRIYLLTPRLRGLLALNMVVATSGAMVIVNSAVIVQGRFGLPPQATALALAAYGAGSMAAALSLPKLLEILTDRSTILAGGATLVFGLAVGTGIHGYQMLLAVWFILGIGYSLAQTPAARIINRSTQPNDRVNVFAAHGSFMHAGWFITYPLSGWLVSIFTMPMAFAMMSGVALAAITTAILAWPRYDPQILDHSHDGLPADNPHWLEGASSRTGWHSHPFVIDQLHTQWPTAR